MKLQHDNAQRNINVLCTLPRWLQILNFCFEDYEKALSRGVKYRVVIEASDSEIRSQDSIQVLLTKPNFELRLSGSPLRTNASIFDQKEVTINFFPSQSLAESPVIWTNHPSFILMCQDHFIATWKMTKKYKRET
jgi:hypothetical protein